MRVALLAQDVSLGQVVDGDRRMGGSRVRRSGVAPDGVAARRRGRARGSEGCKVALKGTPQASAGPEHSKWSPGETIGTPRGLIKTLTPVAWRGNRTFADSHGRGV